jgi:hypothetical protein
MSHGVTEHWRATGASRSSFAGQQRHAGIQKSLSE